MIVIRLIWSEYTGMAEEYVRAAGELGYPRADLNGYYTEGNLTGLLVESFNLSGHRYKEQLTSPNLTQLIFH